MNIQQDKLGLRYEMCIGLCVKCRQRRAILTINQEVWTTSNKTVRGQIS